MPTKLRTRAPVTRATEFVLRDLHGRGVFASVAAGRREPWRLECGGSPLSFRQTYTEAARGEHLALIDSYGLIKAARRDGDAAASLRLPTGSTVQPRKTP